MIVCCKGCTERAVGCHSTCTKYIEAKKIHLQRCEIIWKERRKECEYQAFHKDSRLESIKRKQLRDGRGRK